MSDRDAVRMMQKHAAEAEVERLRLVEEVETLRQRAEAAEARLASITGMTREELARDVATRQREACAEHLDGYGCMATPDELVEWVRATPLVTDAKETKR